MMVSEVSVPGVNVNSAAVDELDVSSPIVAMKGEVVSADPGFVTVVKVRVTSDTSEFAAKASVTVRTRPETEQVKPDIGTPLIEMSRHYELTIIDGVYS